MEKLVSYICSEVGVLKQDMGLVAKVLKAQNKQLGLVGICIGLCGCYIFINEKDKKEDREKIESLTKEVEELKKLKGE